MESNIPFLNRIYKCEMIIKPCKKCLVRPTCQEPCYKIDKRFSILRFIDRSVRLGSWANQFIIIIFNSITYLIFEPSKSSLNYIYMFIVAFCSSFTLILIINNIGKIYITKELTKAHERFPNLPSSLDNN